MDGYFGLGQADGGSEFGLDYDPVDTKYYGFGLLYNFKESQTYVTYFGAGMIFHSGATKNVDGDKLEDSYSGFAGFIGIDKYLVNKIGLSARVGYQTLDELWFQIVDPVTYPGVSWGDASHSIDPSSLFLQLTITFKPF